MSYCEQNTSSILLCIWLCLQVRAPVVGPCPPTGHASPRQVPGNVYYRYVPVQIANASPPLYYQQQQQHHQHQQQTAVTAQQFFTTEVLQDVSLTQIKFLIPQGLFLSAHGLHLWTFCGPGVIDHSLQLPLQSAAARATRTIIYEQSS